jgi:acetyl esterase/lipase
MLNHQRHLNIPIVHQVLLHPLIDSTSLTNHFSQYEFQNGPLLTSKLVAEGQVDYFANLEEHSKQITASPILMSAKQAKTFMPSTTIVTSQIGWLRDQAHAFAQLLQTSGVACGVVEAFASLHICEVLIGARTSPTPELIMIAIAGKLQKVLLQMEATGHSRKRARAGKREL